jgi:hypothetical protein
MNCDSQHGARCNLGHAPSCQLVLGLLPNIDVTVDFGSSARVHNVLRDLGVSDDGCILLARRDCGTIAGYFRVDCRCGEQIEDGVASEHNT